ncbi:chorismate mutase [Streptomyces chilikensis]|uniref:Chorismate mutase n=1 Tax=Streptomyces chilikensis TaxID=1194079 RepID=A0ABV3EKH2_9ACTN
MFRTDDAARAGDPTGRDESGRLERVPSSRTGSTIARGEVVGSATPAGVMALLLGIGPAAHRRDRFRGVRGGPRAPGGGATMWPMSQHRASFSLAEIRERIDALDADLVHLLARREKLVREAAGLKKDERAVRAPDRAERVVAAARAEAERAGLTPAVAETVWRAMVGAFIDLELTEHRREGAPR